MSRLGEGRPVHVDGFPRVSGDEPAGDKIVIGLNEFSPRERG